MVNVGTGTKSTRFVTTKYPITSGLTAGTEKQTGRTTNLVPQEKSLVSSREKVGL